MNDIQVSQLLLIDMHDTEGQLLLNILYRITR